MTAMGQSATQAQVVVPQTEPWQVNTPTVTNPRCPLTKLPKVTAKPEDATTRKRGTHASLAS